MEIHLNAKNWLLFVIYDMSYITTSNYIAQCVGKLIQSVWAIWIIFDWYEYKISFVRLKFNDKISTQFIHLQYLQQAHTRTKHIAIKYHHFRKHVNKTIMVNSIDTKEQTADILTKPIEKGSFEHLRKKLCGWWFPELSRGSVSMHVMRKTQFRIWNTCMFKWYFFEINTRIK